MKTLEQRLQDAENAIKQAEIEVGLRKKQLQELKPKRLEYENQSLADFGVNIQDLESYIQSQEQHGEALITELENELSKVS